jgi:hypothetical protein
LVPPGTPEFFALAVKSAKKLIMCKSATAVSISVCGLDWDAIVTTNEYDGWSVQWTKKNNAP